MGQLADLRGPPSLVQRAIDAFVQVYGVDLSEAAHPEGGYASFDAFFTRQLVDGARPVEATPGNLVSPADGRVEDVGPINADAMFRVKGRLYSAADMVGAGDASRFGGGSFAVIYLSPPDYHRVHAPVAGDVQRIRHAPGTLFPVNSIGSHVPQLLARNERVAVEQRCVEQSVEADVVTVLVGAIGVGRISLAFDDRMTNTGAAWRGDRLFGDGERHLKPGDEIGAFHLGSTVVLLTSKPVRFKRVGGDTVRVGQALGHWDSQGAA